MYKIQSEENNSVSFEGILKVYPVFYPHFKLQFTQLMKSVWVHLNDGNHKLPFFGTLNFQWLQLYLGIRCPLNFCGVSRTDVHNLIGPKKKWRQGDFRWSAKVLKVDGHGFEELRTSFVQTHHSLLWTLGTV